MEEDEEQSENHSLLDTDMLLMNKNSYKKYMSKHNNDHLNLQNDELLKYKSQIMEFTENKLNDIDISSTSDLDEIFNAYTQKLIHHFKQKEIEKANLFNVQDNLDNSDDENGFMHTPLKSSFWGKHTVVKKH